MTVDDWDAVSAVHLRGNFFFSRAVQPFMRENGWGRIVNLSSLSALGNFGQTNHAAAKAGVQGITKTLSIELGPCGTTINAVAPGFIETDMTAATAARMGVPFEKLKESSAAEIPVRRVGQPADIAAVIAFLASEEASFISSQLSLRHRRTTRRITVFGRHAQPQ